MQDCCITVRELTDEVGVSIGSVHTILTADLGLRRVSAKFVPKLLTVEQKQLRLEIALYMLDYVESDSNFLNTVITGDESWAYGYDPETKAQSSQWRHPLSPRPKKARQVRSNVKVLLTFFFTPVGCCITNAHKAQQSPKSTTREYFVAFVMMCGANDRTWGQQKLGSSITTMRPPILRI
jgi:histone-lysine N-methyltransferase SETMAR